MSKRILAICHSAGDSQAIISTAKSLSSKKISTTVLVIGKMAKTKVSEELEQTKNAESPYLDMLDIDLLCEEKPIQNDLLKLSGTDLEKLIQAIENKKFDGLLVGTPSYVSPDKQTIIPQQILERLSTGLPSAVFSDYAFYEDKHTLSKDKWFNLATKFLVPFKKAIEAFKANHENTVVVGLPAIDSLKLKYAPWVENEPQTREAILKKLASAKLDTAHPFVFVAGGKAGDEDLIEALAIASKEVPDLKIYIGVHPAAEHSYIAKLQTIIDQHQKNNIMSILPKGSIETDEAVYLSQGVISVSSTVSTTTAACGKLAAYFQQDKNPEDSSVPYIVADRHNARFYSTRNELITFLKEAKAASYKINANQVIVHKSASDNIADTIEDMLEEEEAKTSLLVREQRAFRKIGLG